MNHSFLDLQIFYHPQDRLRVTWGDRSWPKVKPVWSAPHSSPGKYLSLLDGRGKEIAFVANLGTLTDDARATVTAELRQRYLTCQVTRIVTARQEYGATYWTAETDRGIRDFVTQSLQENAVWVNDDHLLLIDVDGNRFELRSVSSMDARSQGFIQAIL